MGNSPGHFIRSSTYIYPVGNPSQYISINPQTRFVPSRLTFVTIDRRRRRINTSSQPLVQMERLLVSNEEDGRL